MRVWVKPDQLEQLSLTVSDVYRAIKQQNVIAPAGQIGGPPAPQGTESTFVVKTAGRLESPEQFGEIVIKSDDKTGSLIRLKDVARVELGTQLHNAQGRFNGCLLYNSDAADQ